MLLFDRIDVLNKLRTNIEVLGKIESLKLNYIQYSGKSDLIDSFNPFFTCPEFAYDDVDFKDKLYRHNPYANALFYIEIDYTLCKLVITSPWGEVPKIDGFPSEEYINKLKQYFLPAAIEHRKQQYELDKNRPAEPYIDHLYLIHDTVLNALKIGRSKNPKQRLKTLQFSTCNNLELICVCNDIGGQEKETHEKFKDIRLASEWFQYHEDIINHFKELQH